MSELRAAIDGVFAEAARVTKTSGAPRDALPLLARTDPPAGARLAGQILTLVSADREERGLGLLRALRPGILLDAARSKVAQHVVFSLPARPAAPDYQAELVPIGDVVKSDEDVLAYVTERGWQQPIWEACTHALGPVDNPIQRLHHAREATPDVLADEWLAHAAYAIAWSALPLPELQRTLDEGYGGPSEEALALFGARGELSDPAVCLDLLERLVVLHPAHEKGGTLTVRNAQLAQLLIERLGAARHEPAAPVLAALASCHTPYGQAQREAVNALAAIGTLSARQAMTDAIGRVIDRELIRWDPAHVTLFAMPMIKVIIEIDPDTAYDALSPLFAPARLATGAGAAVTRDLLAVVGGSVGFAHAVVKLLHPDGQAAFQPVREPRWVDLFVRLQGDDRLRASARHVFKRVDKVFADEALARVVGTEKAPKPPPNPSAEVVASGDARARASLAPLRAELVATVAKAKKAKVPLRAKGKAVAAEVDVTIAAGLLAQIEKLTKAPIPSALRALYEVVGPVDLTPGPDATVPAEWTHVTPAPLIVQPLERGFRELKARLRDNVGVPWKLRDPVSLEISPDGVRVLLVPFAEDPRLEGDDRTLLQYLRR